MKSILLSIVCLALIMVSTAKAELDFQTETLIEQLPKISQIGYGYSAMFSGSQFLPEPNSSEVHTLLLGSEAPTNSAVLENIVRGGVLAVPSLLKHLEDARETKIPAISGMMWISFADEYDYNRRVRTNAPTGVNRDDFQENHPKSHVITVGDLCFVALGQIVNRNFNASRYQPSGGVIISSPTYSKRLCEVVRADFEGLTEAKHRDMLVQDFTTPDYEDRRNNACRRIAFYYPQILEPLVLKQLAVPSCDVFKIENLVRNKLYPNKSKEKRRTIYDGFLRTNGPAYADGIREQLFEDLDTQIADEEHRVSPPLNGKYDARALLVQLYGYSNAVAATNTPYETCWNMGEEARFIDSLGNLKSHKIDEAIKDILIKVTDDDYLALACMKHLMGRGYEPEIRAYCERRIPVSKNYAKELQQIVTQLDATKNR